MHSVLVAFLFEAWAWGYMSPSEAQRIASLATDDIKHAQSVGARGAFEDLEKIRKIGTQGKYSQHMRRDMESAMPPCDIPRPSFVNVPTRAAGGAVLDSLQSIIYPHLLFRTLFVTCPAAFFARLVVAPELVTEFWHSVSHTAQYASHTVGASRSPHEVRPAVCAQ